ncbi:hypothetical protein [Gemmatimonas groenlandica]|uniref:Uncharacterized protein n=1 Tax=Gemmatimonas groenlandica TaxID=2732249 RepID=A0A6M4IQ48_9BACT|nr:hypothetical protein [Gemmatimonas groenlandica]QJR36823.1 hypothetical protein HKW67_15505 [Gemmatimonas groenlandica]
MPTPSSTLLRQLFPSWAFFDEARLPPTLQLRLLPDSGTTGSWQHVIRPSPRRWWHVVFNPAGTQTLAAQTLVERWYTELVELGERSAACQESLSLVTSLAEHALAEHALAASTDGRDAWQLRLIVTDDDDGVIHVVYESDRLLCTNVRGTS